MTPQNNSNHKIKGLSIKEGDEISNTELKRMLIRKRLVMLLKFSMHKALNSINK
jgi:hypothetical protein